MREELRYEPADASHVARLRSILHRFEALSEGDPRAPALVAEFSRVSRRNYTEYDLSNYWRSTDEEVFLDEAARPQPAREEAIQREELIDLVRAIIESTGEAEQNYYMQVFDAQVSMPRASLLVFNPPDGVDAGEWEPAPEQVVEIALGYKPIQL